MVQVFEVKPMPGIQSRGSGSCQVISTKHYVLHPGSMCSAGIGQLNMQPVGSPSAPIM
eukprot:CAMPEP_0115871664 /NCGR_PEP_ID=MMETSP0287-20121206/23004_1 /TAXON_ID=412157 /ORGANISM="Chrysochromulina rotalis, Strain UIO044" /LENGTH=57 /DNA_ID=CAMNT_0003326515 /DNA_START=588 /DNA_END=761 /DNA_ORIENTATION=-